MEVVTLSDNKRLFPYEKAIVLNALYDALDALTFVINRSNSVRGTLLVSSKTFPAMRGRIAISPTFSGEQTLVEIFADDGDESHVEWRNALLDEAQSFIRRAEMKEIK